MSNTEIISRLKFKLPTTKAGIHGCEDVLDLREKIFKNVKRNQSELIDFLKELISVPSVTGNEKGIQHLIARKLDQMG